MSSYQLFRLNLTHCPTHVWVSGTWKSKWRYPDVQFSLFYTKFPFLDLTIFCQQTIRFNSNKPFFNSNTFPEKLTKTKKSFESFSTVFRHPFPERKKLKVVQLEHIERLGDLLSCKTFCPASVDYLYKQENEGEAISAAAPVCNLNWSDNTWKMFHRQQQKKTRFMTL